MSIESQMERQRERNFPEPEHDSTDNTIEDIINAISESVHSVEFLVDVLYELQDDDIIAVLTTHQTFKDRLLELYRDADLTKID